MDRTAMHSPGPWWSLAGNNYIMSAVAAGGRPVCRMDDLECSAGEREANRALVLAAPDLLAALRLAESFMSGFEGDEAQDPPVDERLEKMRAAIAKAEGRSP
jgi:hypothetical protein